MRENQVERQMDVIVNGELRKISSPMNLLDLVAFLDLNQDRVAIELNRGIVRRDRWPATELHPGDRLEIVQFVGGG